MSVHERQRANATTQEPKDRAKKWPLRCGAAKFREETPRKGGGFAIEDRNTALQQYAEKRFGASREKQIFLHIFPQKHRRFSQNDCRYSPTHASLHAWCGAVNTISPVKIIALHGTVAGPKQKIRANPLV